MNKSLRLLLITLLTLILFNCASTETKEETYIKNNEPSDVIYSSPSRDPGMYQSPINILSSETEKRLPLHQFSIHFKDEITAVENLGHTIQLDFNSGSTITLDKRTYTFEQMHFHTPSEHLIDGITYPMELHIVTSNKGESIPHYLVIGLLFKMGKENKFLNEFLTMIPNQEHSKTLVKVNNIKLKDLLSKDDLTHYYHYKGSLTTPPYTETVHWFVLKKVFEASPKQIKTINSIEGNNARHIEPEKDRLIEDN